MKQLTWRILSIGNLSMNKFWGETERKRGPYATCSLIEVDDLNIIVDPSLPPEQIADILDRRRGIAPEQVDLVYVTHFHGDHRWGVEAFPSAKWLMASIELAAWRKVVSLEDKAIADRFLPAELDIPQEIELLPTPGHTKGHTSLRFKVGGQWVVIAGDAVMTEDYFRGGEPFHNAADAEAATDSIQLLRREADIIVPGHDNYFLVR